MSRRPKRPHGEAIDLNWEYDPEWYAVRGHVTAEEFAAEWDRFYEPGWTAKYCDGEPRHMWARTEVRHGFDGGCVSIYLEKGRGCFPVTVADRRVHRSVPKPEAVPCP